MRNLISLITIGLGLSFGAAQAQVQKLTPQQFRTATCEKAAGNKKGSERAAFVRACMAPKSEPQMTQTSGCEHGSRAEDRLRKDDSARPGMPP